VVPEAQLVETEHGLVPEGEGWFVVNAREARWVDRSPPFDRSCRFEGEALFPQLGVNIRVLDPGRPNCYYHAEADQEDLLVLAGECLLVVEGQERRLRAWDFVHLAPWTEHVLVGAGDRPCVVVMVGGREKPGIRYPASEAALVHGAGVERETESPEEAYAGIPPRRPTRYRDGDLP